MLLETDLTQVCKEITTECIRQLAIQKPESIGIIILILTGLALYFGELSKEKSIIPSNKNKTLISGFLYLAVIPIIYLALIALQTSLTIKWPTIHISFNFLINPIAYFTTLIISATWVVLSLILATYLELTLQFTLMLALIKWHTRLGKFIQQLSPKDKNFQIGSFLFIIPNLISIYLVWQVLSKGSGLAEITTSLVILFITLSYLAKIWNPIPSIEVIVATKTKPNISGTLVALNQDYAIIEQEISEDKVNQTAIPLSQIKSIKTKEGKILDKEI